MPHQRFDCLIGVSMALEKLGAKEQEIVLRCIKASAVHIEDWEKHTRLGLTSDELRRIIAEWRSIDDADENGTGFLAINNCLNEVCQGFSIAPEEWRIRFDVPKADIENTYRKWLSLRGASGGIR